jgi:hypothetical protein
VSSTNNATRNATVHKALALLNLKAAHVPPQRRSLEEASRDFEPMSLGQIPDLGTILGPQSGPARGPARVTADKKFFCGSQNLHSAQPKTGSDRRADSTIKDGRDL